MSISVSHTHTHTPAERDFISCPYLLCIHICVYNFMLLFMPQHMGNIIMLSRGQTTSRTRARARACVFVNAMSDDDARAHMRKVLHNARSTYDCGVFFLALSPSHSLFFMSYFHQLLLWLFHVCVRLRANGERQRVGDGGVFFLCTRVCKQMARPCPPPLPRQGRDGWGEGSIVRRKVSMLGRLARCKNKHKFCTN